MRKQQHIKGYCRLCDTKTYYLEGQKEVRKRLEEGYMMWRWFGKSCWGVVVMKCLWITWWWQLETTLKLLRAGGDAAPFSEGSFGESTSDGILWLMVREENFKSKNDDSLKWFWDLYLLRLYPDLFGYSLDKKQNALGLWEIFCFAWLDAMIISAVYCLQCKKLPVGIISKQSEHIRKGCKTGSKTDNQID